MFPSWQIPNLDGVGKAPIISGVNRLCGGACRTNRDCDPDCWLRRITIDGRCPVPHHVRGLRATTAADSLGISRPRASPQFPLSVTLNKERVGLATTFFCNTPVRPLHFCHSLWSSFCGFGSHCLCIAVTGDVSGGLGLEGSNGPCELGKQYIDPRPQRGCKIQPKKIRARFAERQAILDLRSLKTATSMCAVV